MDPKNTTRPKVLTNPSHLLLSVVVCLSTSLTSSARVPHNQDHAKPATIFVDPDVRVSYDGDVVHMETYVAASATLPDLLLAGGELVVPGRNLRATEARLYRSSDAGASWAIVLLPDEVNGGWDNAIAGGVENTVYFLTSNFEKGLTVYSTNNGGKAWTSTVPKITDAWDRPHIVVDVTAGTYRGRLYVAGEASDGVRVISSADGGKSFSKQVTACPVRRGWNAATDASPVVLSDGTLVVPCAPYPNDPERATWTAAEVGLVTSSDGGQTFTPYHKITTMQRQLPREMYLARLRGDVLLSGNFMQGPSFAVAPAGAHFADRIYALWQDIDSTSRSRLLLTWSADRGVTWSAPVRVDSTQDPDPSLRQGVPMLAVNRDGVVGVAWFDGRHATNGNGYDVYFTTSLDGGLTFLPSVRVSSATSRPAQGLNIVPAPGIAEPTPAGEFLITMTSPFSDRATGGDYSKMAVDAAGRFHPFWADARKGTWELYTATVRVLADRDLAVLASSSTEPSASVSRPCVPNSSGFQLLFGAPEWDSTSNEVVLPVRLRNKSPNLIAEAINVRVSIVSPKQEWSKLIPDAAALVPRIRDPTKASLGNSATFVYPVSPSSPLFPNSVTSSQEWRLHVEVPDFMNFSVQAVITTGNCAAK
jgi:hypothetical protein